MFCFIRHPAWFDVFDDFLFRMTYVLLHLKKSNFCSLGSSFNAQVICINKLAEHSRHLNKQSIIYYHDVVVSITYHFYHPPWTIHNSSKKMDPKPIPSHRFLQAQHQRTLLHPKLLQPTEEYERLHKLKLASRGDSRDSLENPERVPLCLPCAPVPAIANVQNHNDEYPPHLSKKNGLHEDDADTSSSSSQNVRGATRTHAGTAIDINSEMGQTRVNNEVECHSPQHTFVVCADSQLGMTSLNAEWETELDYCRQAVHQINNLEPRPKFVTACGDLVDMEQSFYYNNEKSLKDFELKECERIQKKQFDDWKHVFDCLHEDIALVCLCGNHDIGM